jgi:hypothetical protein
MHAISPLFSTVSGMQALDYKSGASPGVSAGIEAVKQWIFDSAISSQYYTQ